MLPNQDRLLHALTAPQLAAARPRSTALDGRLVELEVAAWLHLPGLSDLPVSLLVSYLDGDQEREVSVDHGRIDPQQRILLSGVARLPLKQSLSRVELRLRSAFAPQSLKIEEIFVQPVISNVA
ncbi:hypothetical protein KRX52_01820 [Pseudomonas sp. MAP12]|uniref:Uncharacterized protein n=1 Tax=Geopseudomonas aromaticivorans TaxID=2849492 RepID=A0ABS6MT68_9GAMM|nr:hypothetical protein [Pseudomonas aromaticivorans]MBV2131531.1 hypothetical protein [Pseudomonas aromaticivorans]